MPAASAAGDRLNTGTAIALEQAVEVVAAHGPVVAAVLEQEAGHRRLQQAGTDPSWDGC